jgi:hypothetical protein
MSDNVDLQHEHARTDQLVKSFGEGYVPLPVAAAMTFHQVHGNTRAIVSRDDYDDALNIAAVALSRLVPLYVIGDPRDGHTPLSPDFTRQHFARGATELRCADAPPVRDMSIKRSDLLSAVSLIKRAGLPFAFAIERAPEAPGSEPPSTPPQVVPGKTVHRG